MGTSPARRPLPVKLRRANATPLSRRQAADSVPPRRAPSARAPSARAP